MTYKKDKYYTAECVHNNERMIYIWKCAQDRNTKYSHRLIYYLNEKHSNANRYNVSLLMEGDGHGWTDNRLSTFEEITWLDACIAASEYVTKEEATKHIKQSNNPDPELTEIIKKLLNLN